MKIVLKRIKKGNLFLKKMIRSSIFLYLCTLSSAQNIYQGEIGFNYNGTVNGSFTSISEDSLLTGILINQVVNDTALLVMASITQQDENEAIVNAERSDAANWDYNILTGDNGTFNIINRTQRRSY